MISVKSNRREFLRQSAAAGTAVVAASGMAKPILDADVIVVGAGMSGIAAAATLATRRRVIVLEARPDRIGGRIWTSHAWPDEPVDLGASWLTHEEINPLRAFADRAGIRTIPSNFTSLYVSEADGQRLTDLEFQDLLALYGDIYADVQALSVQRLLQGLPDLPASKAFDQVLAKRPLTPEMRRRIDFCLNLFIKEPQAAELRDVGLFNLGNDPYTTGALGSASIMPEGYVQFVNILGAGLDIRLGSVVDVIAYGPAGVTVTLRDPARTTLRANQVLVTVPLGVLKARSIKFQPALPAWKQQSIDRLGFGNSQKLYFRFPQVFWPTDRVFIDRIAETPESKWSTWLDFFKYSEGKATLLSFNHGAYAAQLEQMSDTDIVDAAYSVLKKQYKDRALRPIALQRSHWGTDPFARGVFPQLSTGASEDDFTRLGDPVGDRLFFAGDATVTENFGFVLGAYQSGLREGQRILGL